MTREEVRAEILSLCEKVKVINHIETMKNLIGNCSNIVLYGAGHAGSVFKNYFDNYLPEKKIKCFLNKGADIKPEYLGYSVYKPDDERLDSDFRNNSVVILTLLSTEDVYDKIEQLLLSLGYPHIVNGYYTNISLLNGHESIIHFAEDAEIIEAAFNMMEDEHSRNVFYSTFQAHATINYKLPLQSEGMVQYFDVDVPFRHKYRSFVDCGAYIGDTFEELVKLHNVENYFAFEPDMQNYEKLIETVKKFPNIQSVLFPLGISDYNKFLHFTSNGSAGRIDNRVDNTINSYYSVGKTIPEDIIIQTVRLSDVLKGYDKLMIKMDIEGSEIAALNGAKELIIKTKPDLAVSVYHKPTDLWRIPYLLKEWVPEYKIFMRNHHAYTIETVVYATIKE